MLLKQLIALSMACAIIIVPACGSSAEKTIVKRWKVAGRIKGGKEEMVPEDKMKNNNRSVDFTKDGKMFMYDGDELHMTALYTMGSDGKSIVITDPSGSGESGALKILDLEPGKLVTAGKWMSDRADTIILSPY